MKLGVSETFSVAASSTEGVAKGCSRADKSSAVALKSVVSETFSVAASLTEGVSKGCSRAAKSSAVVLKSGVLDVVLSTASPIGSVSYTFRKSCNSSGVWTSATVFFNMISGDEAFRKPASPEGGCEPDEGSAAVVSILESLLRNRLL